MTLPEIIAIPDRASENNSRKRMSAVKKRDRECIERRWKSAWVSYIFIFWHDTRPEKYSHYVQSFRVIVLFIASFLSFLSVTVYRYIPGANHQNFVVDSFRSLVCFRGPIFSEDGYSMQSIGMLPKYFA